MATICRFLIDKYGNILLPITHEHLVRDSEGVSLDTKLAALASKTAKIVWDGNSVPVIEDIPAGVTVTYNGTQYTGTLAASPATDGRTYMVANGRGEYDRYITTLDTNNAFVWIPLGDTTITLEIVDNLVDGGRDKALSAEQGKVLSDKIDNKFVFLTEDEWEALTTIDPDKFYCTYEDEEEEEV